MRVGPLIAKNLLTKDDEGHTGFSNPFGIRRAPGTLDHFAWSPIPTLRTCNTPFEATITALDALGNVLPNYSGPAQIRGRRDLPAVRVGLGTNRSSYPLATFFHQARCQAIYLASELGEARTIGALSLQVAVPPSQPLTHWVIRLKQTPLDHYPAGFGWENEDWITVHDRMVVINGPGWVQFVFDTPFAYDGQRNLMVDFSFNNPSFSLYGECLVTPTPKCRSIRAGADSEYGDPLLWSEWFPPPALALEIPNLLLASAPEALASQPQITGTFVNGAWTGMLTVSDPGSNVRLVAEGGAGQTGESNPFTSALLDDVSVTLGASANPAPLGEPLTLTSCVSNTGPTAATGVILTQLLPEGCQIVGVTVSQGNYAQFDRLLHCELGTLGPGARSQLTAVLIPIQAGPLVSTAEVIRAEPDAYSLNNVSTNLVLAKERALFVQSSLADEGDHGISHLLFQLYLSLPAVEPLELTFSTQDLSATEGVDYLPTNGVIVFNPGAIAVELPVAILGDKLPEPTELFALRFSVAPAQRLQFTDAVGTIRDDDDVDSLPLLVVDDARVVEGDSGTRQAVFRLGLSAPSETEVGVYYQTSDDTAQRDSDYAGTSSSIAIPPGQTNSEIRIAVYGDTELEPDERFRLHIPSVAGARAPADAAIGYILSDDVRAEIRARDRAIVSETIPNLTLDPEETVTVGLELFNQGNANTTNLVATLLAGDGVLAPSGPVSYGVLLANGPPATRQFTFTVGGPSGSTLTARLALQNGATSLGVVSFQWRVGRLGTFRIASLGADGCQAVEHSHTGDDRGGIAASPGYLFHLGADFTALFNLGDLATGALLGRSYDVLVSDLQTETVYALGTGELPMMGPDSYATSLLQIDGSSGALTTGRIDLSRPILLKAGSGIFAGLDGIVLHTGERVFRIDLPDGLVTDLGAMPIPEHVACPHWAYWGVAEYSDGSTHLVYVRDNGRIVRTRVPDGQTTTVAAFGNLGEMCGFTVSLPLNRWYFHHRGPSQFQAGEQIVGYCDAGFQLSDALQLHHFEWSPLATTYPVGTPIAVTVTARDFAGRRVTDFNGTVAVSAVASSIPSTRTLLDSPQPSSSDIGDYTLGYSFTPRTSLTVTHLRHYGGGKVSVWTDAGELLASVPAAASSEAAWSETPLVSPLVLNANARYRVAFYTARGRFFWRAEPPVTFADGMIHQSCQAFGDNFPAFPDSGQGWLVDLRYAPGTYRLPVNPALSGDFIEGIWSGHLILNASGTNILLTAQDRTGRFGRSTPLRLIGSVSGGVDHFSWEPLSSPQTSGIPFLARIRARDELDHPLADFSGLVALSAEGIFHAPRTLRGDAAPSVPFLPGPFTLGFGFTPNTNLTVTHVRHYSGTKVSIWNARGSLLAARWVTNTGPGWAQSALPVPLSLQAHQRYVVGFASGNDPYYWRGENTNTFEHGTIDGSVYASGDRFPDNPFADGWWLVDLRYLALAQTSIPVLPTNVVALVNGAWIGHLILPISGRQVRLRVQDTTAHTGESDPFQVIDETVRLVVRRAGGQTILSWTAWSPGFVLESSTADLEGGWTAVPEGRLLTGPSYSLTNELADPGRFYRLMKSQAAD